MEKKPLTVKQKIKIFNIGRIIAYALIIFGLLMDGLHSPMLWVGFAIFVALSVFRVVAIRCPECEELIPSNFGVMAKACSKCGWHIDQENEAKDENP
jgi:hypothetical protein